MNRPFPNRVIVFGADHHNTLAVIRCLGKHKCDLQLLLHTDDPVQKPCISRSRYAKGLSVLPEDHETILRWLIAHREDRPQIIFPCSDFAMQLIDLHHEALKGAYILPGFQGQPGKAAALMDKMAQKVFAVEHGIPMAKTWSLKLDAPTNVIPPDAVIPCILKPQGSAEGSKGDICVAQSEPELRTLLQGLKDKGYHEILMQQYLHKKHELCAFGCIMEAAPHLIGCTLHKYREFPKVGGSTTYAQIAAESDAARVTQQIVAQLHQAGYRGMYDIELMACEDQVYLNEINFRHSGNGQALVAAGVPAPYLHCLDLLGLPLPPSRQPAAGSYHTDDVADILARPDHGVSILTIIKDSLRAQSHSVFSLTDPGGALGFCMPLAKAFITKHIRKARG